jgi:hypothetical protein
VPAPPLAGLLALESVLGEQRRQPLGEEGLDRAIGLGQPVLPVLQLGGGGGAVGGAQSERREFPGLGGRATWRGVETTGRGRGLMRRSCGPSISRRDARPARGPRSMTCEGEDDAGRIDVEPGSLQPVHHPRLLQV